jgi:lysyl-tRNA synthetase class 1
MPSRISYAVSFRHLTTLVQIYDGDVDRTVASLPGVEADQVDRLKAKCERAKYWVAECAPEDYRFQLRGPGERAELSGEDRAAIAKLRDEVVAKVESFADDKSCAEAIYAVAGSCGMEGKALFRIAYQALVAKDQGPRLASFLRTIDKARLLAILSAY